VPSISMGFCVASMKKGWSRVYVSLPAVTCRSCMASRSALCVLGEARFISSASTMFAKIGPGSNLNSLPPARSSTTYVPVMSEGMRSGVHWMRLNSRSMTFASVLIVSVFPSPG